MCLGRLFSSLVFRGTQVAAPGRAWCAHRLVFIPRSGPPGCPRWPNLPSITRLRLGTGVNSAASASLHGTKTNLRPPQSLRCSVGGVAGMKPTWVLLLKWAIASKTRTPSSGLAEIMFSRPWSETECRKLTRSTKSDAVTLHSEGTRGAG